jgi:Arc/MetJ-type ribon-helix-helix transcriptional regulator
MPVGPDAQTIAFVLSERPIAQLDALVRRGHFATRQTAVTAAVDRLYTAEETRHLTARQAAFTRLCGVLQLGTTLESLPQAECDRLAWERDYDRVWPPILRTAREMLSSST